ncbi:DUF5615 family PIN-like protein [Ferrimicrobium sp.]|uniref:DUF5615 family PIN-like protein n=1 Tax=Ferrimicrobium sp. TaxID=2926050 RepID=UPI00344D6BE4
MLFVVDAQLPPAHARWIKSHGYDAQHLIDLGVLEARDQEIWALSRDQGSASVTKDGDFAMLSVADDHGPSILWLCTASCPTRDLIRILNPLWPSSLN